MVRSSGPAARVFFLPDAFILDKEDKVSIFRQGSVILFVQSLRGGPSYRSVGKFLLFILLRHDKLSP